MAQDEEDCEPCTQAAAISVANMVCKDLKKDGTDCKALFDDVVQERIGVGDYLDRVMEVARGTQLEGSMDEVLRVYRSRGGG